MQRIASTAPDDGPWPAISDYDWLPATTRLPHHAIRSLQRFWGLTVSSHTLFGSSQDPAFGEVKSHLSPHTASPRYRRGLPVSTCNHCIATHISTTVARDHILGSIPLVISKRGGENCMRGSCSLLMPQSLGSSKMFHTCEDGPPPLLQSRKC